MHSDDESLLRANTQAERTGVNTRHQQLVPSLFMVNVLLYSGKAVPDEVASVELHVAMPDTIPYGKVTSHVPSLELKE